jgi:hypothetical protein
MFAVMKNTASQCLVFVIHGLICATAPPPPPSPPSPPQQPYEKNVVQYY